MFILLPLNLENKRLLEQNAVYVVGTLCHIAYICIIVCFINSFAIALHCADVKNGATFGT